MEGIFLTVVNMSIVGGLAIAIVLAVRLLLRSAPKVFSYCLWAVVLYRLVVPFSFDGAFSLIPINKDPVSVIHAQMGAPVIDTGFANIDYNTMLWLLPYTDGSPSILDRMVAFLEMVWLLGALGMAVYGVLSLVRLNGKLRLADHLTGNIYQSDRIDTPFVLGLFRPKIYLPQGLAKSEEEFILQHEQNHIRRGDHIVRVISYFALCIHWFNPLVWIAFHTSGKDMEMANDEAVIRKMGESIKKDYSSSLLSLSTGRRKASPVPLAFGESDPKRRIKNVINYKKPALWVVAASVIFVVSITAGLFISAEKNELLNNPWTPGTIAYEMIDTLNSIEDPEDRKTIVELWSMAPFGGESSSESPEPAISDEEALAILKKLASLSGDALDDEISRTIRASIEKNIDRPNLIVSRYYVEVYVKEYCPEYYDRLMRVVEDNEAQGK